MKGLVCLLLLNTAFAYANTEKYDANKQAAIKNVNSNICHGALLNKTYDNMKSKVDGVKHIAYDTLKNCIISGGRQDKRYAKYFPELSLIELERAEQGYLDVLKDTNKSSEDKTQAIKELELTQEVKKATEQRANKQQQEAEDELNFYGFNWAPGIALMGYSSPYVSDVRIETTGEGDSQTHRVFIDKQVDHNIAVMLETHYLWPVQTRFEGRSTGVGFFAATNLAKKEGDPLTVFSLGLMGSVKSNDSSNGFSVGIGIFVDTDFTELRDGLTDGAVTTYSDSSKLLRKVDETGWMLILSSKF